MCFWCEWQSYTTIGEGWSFYVCICNNITGVDKSNGGSTGEDNSIIINDKKQLSKELAIKASAHEKEEEGESTLADLTREEVGNDFFDLHETEAFADEEEEILEGIVGLANETNVTLIDTIWYTELEEPTIDRGCFDLDVSKKEWSKSSL